MNIDAGPNADWLKGRTWDVRNPDWTLVSTPEELRAAVAPMFGEGESWLTHFMTLPAAAAMPAALRASLGLQEEVSSA